MKRKYNEFNRGCGFLNDEFHEGRPNSLVVPETIDALQHMIIQDRHVTYCEIETTLGISPNSIHKTLHEHLAVKKALSLNPTQFVKSPWSKFNGGASKEVYKIVTGD